MRVSLSTADRSLSGRCDRSWWPSLMSSHENRVCDTERDHCSDATRVMSQASAIDHQVHLQRARRRKRVVGGRRHGRDRRVVAGRVVDDQVGGQARLDLPHRGQVGIQPLPIGAAQAGRGARELRADAVEHRLPPPPQPRQHRRIGVQVGEYARVDAGRIVVGRQRLVGGAVDHAPPVVGRADLHAELERPQLGRHRQPLRDALIDRCARRPARGGRADARERAGVQHLARSASRRCRSGARRRRRPSVPGR